MSLRSKFQQALAACEHGWPRIDEAELSVHCHNVNPGKKRVPETAAAAEEITFQ
jgi:hypothetical protein